MAGVNRVNWMFFAGLMLVGFSLPVLAAENAANTDDKAKVPNVQIKSDPCIELVSVIFHLAGNAEYGRIRMDSYAKDITEHFGKFREYEAIILARTASNP